MNNAMLESLPNTESNEFMKIHRESKSLEELHMATYLRALKPDIFNLYQYIREPITPKGWEDHYSEYLEVSNPESKIKLWKKIKEIFYGYLRAIETQFSENESNKKLLIEMMVFFKSKNMPGQESQIRHRLKSFGYYEKT